MAPGVSVHPVPADSTAQEACEWCKARALHLLLGQFLLLLHEP